MPNHVENELRVFGPRRELIIFRDHVADEYNALSANKLIPYPSEFEELDKKAEEWRKKWNGVLELIKEEDPDKAAALRTEAFKKFKAENGDWPKDGFNSGGYEWCISHWGTKWGFYEVELVRDTPEQNNLYYTFQTAWSPPIPLIEKMGELFPKIRISLKYFEGGSGFQGVLRIDYGKVVECYDKPYHGGRGG